MDSYIYGFVLQETNLPFDESTSTEELGGMVDSMLQDFPADEYPYLLELTAEHILQPGYNYSDEFDFGLNLILDGLQLATTQEVQHP